MQKTIKSDMIRLNLIMILLVTVCISGLHLYQIYHYTIRQNQEEIMTMSEQARNSLNYMLNQQSAGCASVPDCRQSDTVSGIR